MMKGMAYLIFITALISLLFGGTIYRSLKVMMTFTLVVVFGFLLFLDLMYSKGDIWVELLTGFFKFGTVPIQTGLEATEMAFRKNVQNIFTSLLSGNGFPKIDFSMFGSIAALAAIAGSGDLSNTPTSNYARD